MFDIGWLTKISQKWSIFCQTVKQLNHTRNQCKGQFQKYWQYCIVWDKPQKFSFNSWAKTLNQYLQIFYLKLLLEFMIRRSLKTSIYSLYFSLINLGKKARINWFCSGRICFHLNGLGSEEYIGTLVAINTANWLPMTRPVRGRP